MRPPGRITRIISLDDLLDAYGAELALFAQAMRREREAEQRIRV